MHALLYDVYVVKQKSKATTTYAKNLKQKKR